ncbi:hypothetical protein SAMN05444412_12817 [Rhodonellum ikkaensis]|uniref:Uncharacterized protein n=1 Tax=Rhodonellum ikkaensis TaxID=336829 RepID=A0A1H3U586_9BACT|nr:hypothetical protein SAMN05444412_12817 [Rhodonellum ikkaensis]
MIFSRLPQFNLFDAFPIQFHPIIVQLFAVFDFTISARQLSLIS